MAACTAWVCAVRGLLSDVVGERPDQRHTLRSREVRSKPCTLFSVNSRPQPRWGLGRHRANPGMLGVGEPTIQGWRVKAGRSAIAALSPTTSQWELGFRLPSSTRPARRCRLMISGGVLAWSAVSL